MISNFYALFLWSWTFVFTLLNEIHMTVGKQLWISYANLEFQKIKIYTLIIILC